LSIRLANSGYAVFDINYRLVQEGGTASQVNRNIVKLSCSDSVIVQNDLIPNEVQKKAPAERQELFFT